MFATDSIFRMGSTHKICEDYAIHGSRNGLGYAIVSDGCSGATDEAAGIIAKTEMGSRLLCYAAARCIEGLDPLRTMNEKDVERWGWEVLARARADQLQLGIDANYLHLYSTLAVAVTNGDQYRVAMFGDGAWFLAGPDGPIANIGVYYAKNAPFYLAYNADGGRAGYVSMFSGDAHEAEFMPGREPSIVKTKHECKPAFVWTGSLAHVGANLIGVSTDGQASFTKAEDFEILPGQQRVLMDFSKINSKGGLFLNRRVGRVIENYKKEGYVHTDDLGVAAVMLDPYA